ncbi:DNRLRE domain-containing protein [Nonomuraea sp. MCN248]|uniref:DNRLRE domain-containing protein n=1 Tax=Nonomuraea corallina TaxID=2989783 RepID=A0ABT4S845_9ACTN|nr:DNRLRE domain-containing protein [Nonomuraea corallina]MDA0633120.1 DNRLRE domain-containing protein [Nonomuraea corallina]
MIILFCHICSKGTSEPITNSVRLIQADAPPGCPGRGSDHAALAHGRARDRPGPNATTNHHSGPHLHDATEHTRHAHQQSARAGEEGQPPVEIESLRSENATYYANPDGKTVRMEQHLQPIRVKNAKGDGFTSVDTTLVETDGVIKPKAVKGDLTLSAGDDAFVLKSKGSKGSATIGSPGELPKPTLKGSTATYPSVYGNGIDLVVTATATGFKQEIVLRERSTEPVSFRIPATVPKSLALDKDTTAQPALLSEGKKIADLPPALLLDAVATDLDSDIDAGKVGRATVTLDEGASALVYTPDPAYLADPAVAYPVTLTAFDDDWWEPDLGNDTFVNNTDYPNGYANSGLDRILVGKSNDGAVRWRSYIRFDEFPDDHPIRGATIQNADLVLWNHLSSDCGEFVGSGITAYQVTERWDVSTLTWASQPRITTTGADTEYAGYAGENCSVRRVPLRLR